MAVINNPHFEDGTPVDPPENPLKEKWDKLYPPKCGLCDDDIVNYSCAFNCDACPRSSSWQIPDEDKEVFEQWKKDCENYYNSHGGFEKIIYSVDWSKLIEITKF